MEDARVEEILRHWGAPERTVLPADDWEKAQLAERGLVVATPGFGKPIYVLTDEGRAYKERLLKDAWDDLI